MVATSPTYFCRIRPAFLRGCRYRPSLGNIQLKRKQVRQLRRAVGRTLSTRKSEILHLDVDGDSWEIQVKYGDATHAQTWWSVNERLLKAETPILDS